MVGLFLSYESMHHILLRGFMYMEQQKNVIVCLDNEMASFFIVVLEFTLNLEQIKD